MDEDKNEKNLTNQKKRTRRSSRWKKVKIINKKIKLLIKDEKSNKLKLLKLFLKNA